MKSRLSVRVLTAILVLVMIFPEFFLCVNANSSTTTYETCFKDESPNTGIYVVTDESYSDYKYYSAKYEPRGGVYYGRTVNGGTLPDGRYGTRNTADILNESALSVYTSVEDPYDLYHWSYLFGDIVADKNHALLINMNFQYEGNSCLPIINGVYDYALINNFNYISTFDFPVFMRIGGEVNVWSVMPSTEVYIAAYRHIADLARIYAPNLALVFSPNSSSGYRIDMDDFYPGNYYVDWMGASLYCNMYSGNGEVGNDWFYGVNLYGDAVLCMQQVVNMSHLHYKPIMITEFGSAWYDNGADTYYYAQERIYRAMSFLTMKYPEIKGIIYSDTNFELDNTRYEIYSDNTLNSIFNTACAKNFTLRKNCNESASYYTNMKSYNTYFEPRLYVFSAYTHDVSHPKARWLFDGVEIISTYDYPYYCQIDFSQCSSGKHLLEVEFSNGAYEYVYLWNFSKEQIKNICNRFPDVTSGSWYVDSMQQAYDMGLISGTTNRTLSPTKYTTRAMFAQMMYNMAGRPSVKYSPVFGDVPENSWYADAVSRVYQNGIVSGVYPGCFKPDSYITREQVMQILYNNKNRPITNGDISRFTDNSDVSAWALDAVKWACETGLVNGYTVKNTMMLYPKKYATRAEIAVLLVGYSKLKN